MNMDTELSRTKQLLWKNSTTLLLFLFLTAGSLSAQSKRISLSVDGVTLKEALEMFRAKSGYSVWFEAKDLNLKKEVSLKLTNVSIPEALNALLKGESVNYEIKGKTIYFEKSKRADTTEILVRGRVFDSEEQSPLIGCNVRIKGRSDMVAITDIDGNYSIRVSPGDMLVFSYIGYDTFEEPVKCWQTRCRVRETSGSWEIRRSIVCVDSRSRDRVHSRPPRARA